MRVHVLQLIVGDRLISDSYNSIGLHLLSAGAVLDAGDITMLSRHNIDYVDIAPRGGTEDTAADTNENASTTATPEQTLAFFDAIEGIKDLFQHAGDGAIIDDEEVEASFSPLIESFENEKDVVSLLLSLNSKDDYTYQHSVQVGMLSYYIAKWMNKNEQEALFVGKAGYLHDIGKSRIPSSILQKPGRLTAEEYNEIKKHTIYGYEIIINSLHDQELAYAALQHHERMDGTGYPLRKKSHEIHWIARIVAVADVYSAMICNRVYQQKRDLLFVLKELHRMSFGELDPAVTQVFIKHMIPNFIGKKACLNDGRIGTIVMTNPTDFFRPLIQVDDQFIDLSQTSGLEISTIAM